MNQFISNNTIKPKLNKDACNVYVCWCKNQTLSCLLLKCRDSRLFFFSSSIIQLHLVTLTINQNKYQLNLFWYFDILELWFVGSVHIRFNNDYSMNDVIQRKHRNRFDFGRSYFSLLSMTYYLTHSHFCFCFFSCFNYKKNVIGVKMLNCLVRECQAPL